MTKSRRSDKNFLHSWVVTGAGDETKVTMLAAAIKSLQNIFLFLHIIPSEIEWENQLANAHQKDREITRGHGSVNGEVEQ